MDEMTASAQVSSADQAVLDDLLAEIAAKIKAGLPVEVQDYAARYPELAGPLQSLLPAIQALGALGQSAEGSLFPHTGEGSRSTTGGCLGDFRILREVGRGGMGIVYETEQISLSRRVALKTLPFAALMDPRHLQRFQNEARTAASLHHPHIVPVYAVGCERGLHYYAMQFIPGQSLAQVIAGLRQSSPGVSPLTPPKPASTVILPKAGAAETVPVQVAVTSFPRPPSDRAYFRQVAEWGIQAAEALEYAHGLGIVHRDIKPANLLLDGQGQVWVTDFGLARVGSDPGLTITGDLVGTLRYMSPEQALAKHGLVDHHTDIYALGATLYELLTLDPAVEGQDRGEILHRIESGDVLAPRHRNRAIPLDLETIVMKAMAPEAGQRYATAQALADDLRHWLEDRPIVARRATAAQRLRRWLWRHRSLVGSVALGALLALVALAGSIGWVVRDWAARRADAEIRLDEALAALGPALEGGDPYDESLRGARRQVEAVLAMGNVGPGPRSEAEDLLNQADILHRLERIRQP
jgi:serine/threonine protein kinase